ncbi:MAG: hypothetical protein WBY88_03900, partial [Desulfosarcina sp.]
MEEDSRGTTWTISNRQEEDSFRTPLAQMTDADAWVLQFQSTPPCEGATLLLCSVDPVSLFQSTPPV